MNHRHIGMAFLGFFLLIGFLGCEKHGAVDAALDDLESVMSKTITVVENMNSGDASAIAKTEKLASEWQSCYDKLEAATKDGYTDAQKQRALGIAKRYQEAIAKTYSK